MHLTTLVLKRRSWDDVIVPICDLLTKSKLQAVSVWLREIEKLLSLSYLQ